MIITFRKRIVRNLEKTHMRELEILYRTLLFRISSDTFTKNYDHLKRDGIIIKKLLNFMSLKNTTSLIKLLEKNLQEKNWLKLAELLLLHHYDMTYDFAMSKRKGKVLLDLKFNHKVEDVVEIIATKLLSMSWEDS